MNITKTLFAVSAGAMIIFAGCKKDDKKETQDTITSAEDNSQIETEFSAMYEASDDVAQTNGLTQKTGNGVLPNGANITFTDSVFTDGDGVDFFIDYGPLQATAPKGILCKDGRYRSGVLNVSLSKRWSQPGCVFTISAPALNQYYAGNGTDMVQYTGDKSVTRTSDSSWNIVVTNASAITSGGTITWSSSRTVTRTYNAGIGLYGDIYTVTGNAAGNNRNGENFTVTIGTPLVKKVEFPCASTFIKGSLTVSNTSSGKSIAIDYDPYSNMACDRVAKATINGKDYIYTVR